MLNQLTSIAAIETVLMKLTLKQKQFIYQIARLEYRIFKNLLKLEEVEILIVEEENNLNSLNASIGAAGNGKIKEKLLIWKTKTEYKLFKLNLRKNKIDVFKIILNQNKLEQLKQALIALNTNFSQITKQKQNFEVVFAEKDTNITKTFSYWNKMKEMEEENPVNQSIKIYIQEYLKLAS